MVLIYYLFCFIFFMQIFMYAWYLSIQKVISLSLDLLIVYMKWCYSIILVSFIFPWRGIFKIEWHQWYHPFILQLIFCLVWHYCYSDDMDMLILFFFFFLVLFVKKRSAAPEKNWAAAPPKNPHFTSGFCCNKLYTNPELLRIATLSCTWPTMMEEILASSPHTSEIEDTISASPGSSPLCWKYF